MSDLTYGIRRIDGELIELCSECGFDGRSLTQASVVDALRSLGDQWSDVLGGDEAIVRRRPAEHTWCAVEYAVHTRDMIAGNHMVAQFFLDNDTPTLSLPPSADPEQIGPDECGPVDREQIAAELGATARRFADFITELSPEELLRPGRVDDLDGDVLGTARHAIHDATHHILDARRGFARILLDRT